MNGCVCVCLQPHAASLFEQTVNERMQQYDENESEEDLWEEKEFSTQGSDIRQQ